MYIILYILRYNKTRWSSLVKWLLAEVCAARGQMTLRARCIAPPSKITVWRLINHEQLTLHFVCVCTRARAVIDLAVSVDLALTGDVSNGLSLIAGASTLFIIIRLYARTRVHSWVCVCGVVDGWKFN